MAAPLAGNQTIQRQFVAAISAAKVLTTAALGVAAQRLESGLPSAGNARALRICNASTLYRMEADLRTFTVFGMVGARGIGFELISSLKLFEYQDTAMCVIVILAMLMGADHVSSRLRANLLT